MLREEPLERLSLAEHDIMLEVSIVPDEGIEVLRLQDPIGRCRVVAGDELISVDDAVLLLHAAEEARVVGMLEAGELQEVVRKQ